MKTTPVRMRLSASTVGLTLLLVVALLLVGCGSRKKEADSAAASTSLTPISLQLGWFPESEYGGFYAALQQGFYEESGVDVTVKPGGPHMSSIQIVAGGAATFGAEKADSILLARERGIPVVAIAAIMHTSPQALLFHDDQPITDFTDLNGRTVFFVPGVLGYEYVKHKYNLQPKEQVHPGAFGPFINNRESLLHGFAVSEPCDIEGLNYLLIADSGYNVYENIIFTTESVLNEQPEVVRAFLSASIRGWEYYKENSDEVNEFILPLRPEATLESLACKARLQEPMIYGEIADTYGIGYMQPERWVTLREQLIELGALKETTQVDGAFTNRFLPGRSDEEV